MKLKFPYCSLLDAQTECANSSPEAVEALTNAINNASRFIDDECGRDFLYHDHCTTPVRVLREWIGGHMLVLPWPCLDLAVVSVTVDGEAVDASEFEVENDSKRYITVIRRKTPWLHQCSRRRVTLREASDVDTLPKIEVNGEFGYRYTTEDKVSDDIPGTLRYACAVIAAVRSGKLKKESVGLDGSRISMVAKNVPQEAKDIIQRLKLKLTL